MSTSYVIPGISYKEVLEVLNSNPMFGIKPSNPDDNSYENAGFYYGINQQRGAVTGIEFDKIPENADGYVIQYFPSRWVEPENYVKPEVDIFNIDRHGDTDTQIRESYIYLNTSEDMKNAWLFGHAGSQKAFNAILDALGDDYFGLSEHDELYQDYIPDDSRVE